MSEISAVYLPGEVKEEHEGENEEINIGKNYTGASAPWRFFLAPGRPGVVFARVYLSEYLW